MSKEQALDLELVRTKWRDDVSKRKVEYAKVGTVPMLIVVDRRFSMRVGNAIRFRCPAMSWERGVIDKINPDGMLFLSRM